MDFNYYICTIIIKQIKTMNKLKKQFKNLLEFHNIDGIHFIRTLKLYYQFKTNSVDKLFIKEGITKEVVNNTFEQYVNVIFDSELNVTFCEVLESLTNMGLFKQQYTQPFIERIVIER